MAKRHGEMGVGTSQSDGEGRPDTLALLGSDVEGDLPADLYLHPNIRLMGEGSSTRMSYNYRMPKRRREA